MLKKLTGLSGVSGCEMPVREFIYNEIKECCTQITVDAMGNLKAFKKSKKAGAPRVLLSAHMDEVGLIVSHITDEGYLKFQTVGGIEPQALIAQRVSVNGHCGIISLKAVHLTTAEERKAKLTVDKLFIDIGTKDKKDARTMVQKGDFCTFVSDYVEFGDQIKAKALDDRVGCAIMIDVLKKDWDVDLYCNFTVQEEVGLRGSKVATRGINPDFAIVIEGTTCNDLPGVPEHKRTTKAGLGPAISVLDSASVANTEIIEKLEKSAKQHNVPCQFKASTAGGNDAGSIYITDGGIKTASVSVPCRYIHSPVSVMKKQDFENTEKLIEAFIEDLGKDGK